MGDLPGDVQVDEQVGLGDALPHRGHVGVLLDHFAGVVPARPQRPDERGLARGARADYGDQGTFLIPGLSHRFACLFVCLFVCSFSEQQARQP